MRIILFGYSEGMGLTFHLTQLAIELFQLNKELVVVHNGQEQVEGLIKELKIKQIPLFNISTQNIVELLINNKNRETVVHCQGFGQVDLVKDFKTEYNLKLLVTMHAYRHGKWYKNLVVKIITEKYKKVIDLWVFSTYYSYLDFKRMGFKQNFTIVPLGIEETKNIEPVFKYIDVFSKKTEDYSNQKKYIFYAAQFHKHKNHNTLVTLISDVLKQDESLILMLAGDGELMEVIEKLCKKLKIRNQVKFLGRINRDIFLTHFVNARLSVVTSKTETFGHNIIEPLSMGIPVLTTPVGIAPEVIEDFNNGMIFEPNNGDKLKKGIVFFTKNNVDKEAIIEKIKDNFSWKTITLRYNLAYKNLM